MAKLITDPPGPSLHEYYIHLQDTIDHISPLDRCATVCAATAVDLVGDVEYLALDHHVRGAVNEEAV